MTPGNKPLRLKDARRLAAKGGFNGLIEALSIAKNAENMKELFRACGLEYRSFSESAEDILTPDMIDRAISRLGAKWPNDSKDNGQKDQPKNEQAQEQDSPPTYEDTYDDYNTQDEADRLPHQPAPVNQEMNSKQGEKTYNEFLRPSNIATGNKEWGGAFASKELAEKEAANLGKESHELVRAFDRIFRKCFVGASGTETPRLNTKKLVRELVSRRMGLGRIRREEQERGKILLLADISGSCEEVANATLGACLAISKADHNTEVIAHSNGIPEWGNGIEFTPKAYDIFGDQERHAQSYWEALLTRDVVGVVAFGDWDAVETYKSIAAKCPLIWLDQEGSNTGMPESSGNYTGWGHPPFAYWINVGNAVQAVIALRQIAKKGGCA